MPTEFRVRWLRRSTLDAIETALNLNRIYAVVKAYPYISGVPDLMTASRDDVLAGYEEIKANRNLAAMCERAEKDIRAEHAKAIEALSEIVAAAYADGYNDGRGQGYNEGRRDA